MHWNFHCSSCTGCHRLDWLAQWIDLFFLLASWPLHNSVLVLLLSLRVRAWPFSKNLRRSSLDRKIEMIWSRMGLHLISEITLLAFCLSSTDWSVVSLSPWTISQNKLPLMWNVNLCQFYILCSASVGQNLKTTLDVRFLTMKKRSSLYFVVILFRKMN